VNDATPAVADALRAVLLDEGEVAAVRLEGQTPAAVLVPLYLPAPPAPQESSSLVVVLTRRRSDLRRHAGEISFPGGRPDEGDAHLLDTARREAYEEIGLPPEAVTIVGGLQPTSTFVTSYAIHPFVGMIEPGHVWTLSPREVDEVLELPLADLRAGYARRPLERNGFTFRTDTYVVGEHMVWGATARILGDLLDRLAPELDRAAA
jgi:8-oxo-dGTP pyrophosphatase MutT (NUDIX family)